MEVPIAIFPPSRKEKTVVPLSCRFKRLPVPCWFRRNADVLVFASTANLEVGVDVPMPRLPALVTMSAVDVAVGVEVEMRKSGLEELEVPAMASRAAGDVVPKPTFPEEDSTTNLSVCTARPPAKVEVAAVEVAIK